MKKLLLSLALVLSVFALAACNPTADTTTVVTDAPNEAPVISGDATYLHTIGAAFDVADIAVSATDAEDGDLTASLTSAGADAVDVNAIGTEYPITFSVSDSDGLAATDFVVTVKIVAGLANYPGGVNLGKLSVESLDILFAAAESYLLENVYAGVPLYNSAARVIFSDRVQLFSPTYNGVMGYGTAYSQFTEDDSTVEMQSGVMGNADEYTWRASYSTDPGTLNPWLSDDSATSDFTDMFTGGLYQIHFDAPKTGFQFDPSLAEALPVPEEGTSQVINGKTYSKVWLIELKDGLEWQYHPDFDASVLPAGHEELDATDYLETWQFALSEGWFRAKTGGGDFVSHDIKNAEAFLNGDIADVNEVGLSVVAGENTLKLEFNSDKSEFDLKYMFSGASLAPINLALYNYLDGDSDENTYYGKNPESVASSGSWIFDTWTEGQLLTFVKNEEHPDASLFHYTGYQYRYIDGQDVIFAEFEAGRLDSASVPSSRVSQYSGNPNVYVSPGATTWRLMINAFGTTDARDAYNEQYPSVGISTDWVPEPILMYTEMRQALYYGFDREHAAIDVVKTYLPQHTLFASTYFLDADSATSVRGLDAGQAVVDDFGLGSYGYSRDAASVLFNLAVEQAIAEGYYTAGTADAWTVITLELYWASSGNTSAQAMVAELERQYEDVLSDSKNYVKIDLNVNDVAFPTNYYNYMMNGNMDLGIGGISGSLLDAPSFLDVFNDNNAGGFTLNWGIDTTTPNIEVAYENIDGDMVYEVWGYNALVEALNKFTYVKDGEIQESWASDTEVIEAQIALSSDTVASQTAVTDLAEYMLGDTLANIAETEQLDGLNAYVVVTGAGRSKLFVISEADSEFRLYGQFTLNKNAKAAIDAYLGQWNIATNPEPALVMIADDANFATNAYIAALNDGAGYASYAALAEAEGYVADVLEVYYGTYDYNGATYPGAFIVYHVGEYFVCVDDL